MLVKLSKGGNYSQKYDMYMCSVLHFHRCDMCAEVPAAERIVEQCVCCDVGWHISQFFKQIFA